jgi:hypothetical protein
MGNNAVFDIEKKARFSKKKFLLKVVRASGSQCRSCNCPGFDPSILRHSGI